MHSRAPYFAFACLAGAGCNLPMVELKNTSDRIWMISKDGTVLMRCYDYTPDGKPYKGDVHVFCKEAWMYGVATNPPVPDEPEAPPPAPRPRTKPEKGED